MPLTRNNPEVKMFQQINLVRSCLGILAFCCLSNPAFSGPILSNNFNGTGGVPTNWTQIRGVTGDVKETPHHLTITDSTGSSAGIASSLLSSVFDPQGVVTTSKAQINTINRAFRRRLRVKGLSPIPAT
jgi:hypothetical protein